MARRPDVVLQIQDLAVFDQPYVLYQDLSYGVLLRELADHGDVPHFRALSPSWLRRLHERQQVVYGRAAGLLVMSDFLRQQIVAMEGIDLERVKVVNPGIHSTFGHLARSVDPAAEIGLRVVMVGRDFHTKGGDVVVDALAIIRRDHDPRATLTVAGPPTWPLPGDVPEGVRFLGPAPTFRRGCGAGPISCVRNAFQAGGVWPCAGGGAQHRAAVRGQAGLRDAGDRDGRRGWCARGRADR